MADNTTEQTIKDRLVALVPWRTYAALTALTVIGIAAGQPYVAAVSGTDVTAQGVITQVVVNGAISLVAIFVGLWLGKRVDLGAPRLTAALYGREQPEGTARVLLLYAPLVGLGATALIIVLENLFAALAPEAMQSLIEGQATRQPELWKALIASLYGGIFEEVSVRLFIMTAVVWFWSFVVSRVRREPVQAYPATVWVGILFAALVFGIGHLASLAQMGYTDPVLVVRTLALNAVPGVFFGLMYMRFGISAAIVAHFFADIFLHVVVPGLSGAFA